MIARHSLQLDVRSLQCARTDRFARACHGAVARACAPVATGSPPTPGDRARGSSRFSVPPAWADIRFDHPAIWIPLCLVQGFTVFNFTVLLHEVVHHAVFDRRHPRGRAGAGLAVRRAERHLRVAVHALAPRSPRRARLQRGRSEAASPVAEDQRALVQAALLLAGAVPDLLPRRAPGVATYPPSCSDGSPASGGLDRRAPDGARGDLEAGRRRRGDARLRDSRVLRLPDRLHAQPLGQHYDIDPTDPAKWTTLMRGHWFWDFCVPQLELSPRAPLLRRRAVLPPAGAAARAGAVLRPPRDSLAAATGHWSRLAGRQPRAAHRLAIWPDAAGGRRRAVVIQFQLMDFRLTDEQDLLRRSVREFAETEIRPHVHGVGRGAALSRTSCCRSSPTLGLMGIQFPEAYGGAGMSRGRLLHLHRGAGARRSERVAVGGRAQRPRRGAHLDVRHRSAEADVPGAAGAAARSSRAWGLTEPARAATPAAMRTTAVARRRRLGAERLEDVHHARHRRPTRMVVMAVTDKSQGQPKGISAFIVERGTPGCVAGQEGRQARHARQRDQRSASSRTAACPPTQLLGEEGQGFIKTLQVLDAGRIGIAALSVGLAQGAYEAARATPLERKQFGRRSARSRRSVEARRARRRGSRRRGC